MTALLYLGIFLLTFLAMEFSAWFMHKYVMHGFLWTLHEDHHKPELKEGFFERNDAFALFYATLSATFIIIGTNSPYFWLTFVGFGIMAYGVVYFLIHDVYIHKRFSWFRHLDSKYSRAILRAHGAHHTYRDKEDGESFGLLIVHPKYFKSRKERRRMEAEAEH